MISDKAVEAAAQAIVDVRWNGTQPSFDRKPDGWKAHHMAEARAALQAALPVLLEGKAEEIARVIDPNAFKQAEYSRNWIMTNYPEDGVWGGAFGQAGSYLWDVQDALAKANRIISILTGESDER